jgi:hypothetical protein
VVVGATVVVVVGGTVVVGATVVVVVGASESTVLVSMVVPQAAVKPKVRQTRIAAAVRMCFSFHRFVPIKG